MSLPGLLEENGAFNAELGASRGLEFVKDAIRPAVVAFGSNAAFDAVMEAHHVRQLLLFDRFVAPEDATTQADTDAALARAVARLEPALTPLAAAVQKRAAVRDVGLTAAVVAMTMRALRVGKNWMRRNG